MNITKADIANKIQAGLPEGHSVYNVELSDSIVRFEVLDEQGYTVPSKSKDGAWYTEIGNLFPN